MKNKLQPTNIFRPFNATWLSENNLLLELSPARKRLHFIFIVAIPAIIIACLFVLTHFLKDVGMPNWFYYSYLAGLVITAIAAFNIKLVATLNLSRHSIEQNYFRFFSKRKKQFLIVDIDHIYLVVSRGRSAGYYYYVKTKQGKNYLLLNMPRWIFFDTDKDEINIALQKVTGLSVKS
ncbi:MAG: hypothetical protein EOP53_09570 [Sphingobacteriales bacterium]|nr:MAG: hypothetical protein EOP53_09570 [Sphingobacteriales bacterium]